MERLIEGRIVHFVAEGPHHEVEHRAAIICKVRELEGGYVNLQVFWPSINGCYVETHVPYSPSGELGTWHWVEES